MRIREVPPKRAHIAMIPLIDSFFLILVYFIYAFLSMSIHRGIPLELPPASSSVVTKSENHVISITREGLLYLDQQPISEGELMDRLQSVKTSSLETDPVIYLDGDALARHGKVIGVLDDVRRAGFSKVTIETNVTDHEP